MKQQGENCISVQTCFYPVRLVHLRLMAVAYEVLWKEYHNCITITSEKSSNTFQATEVAQKWSSFKLKQQKNDIRHPETNLRLQHRGPEHTTEIDKLYYYDVVTSHRAASHRADVVNELRGLRRGLAGGTRAREIALVRLDSASGCLGWSTAQSR